MASKYDAIKFWKETRARTKKVCDQCGSLVAVGETYYCERLEDPRINFIGKKLCAVCYVGLKGK